jgi:2-polyprenyl-3-methyl-5-hydroxy-6-metoxy-1,4-benzoquinol methylase
MKQRFPHCLLTGIELLEKAAEYAAPAYDRLIVGRFEELDFEELGLAHGDLDTIIVADFLEHLANPWKALQRLRPLLGPTGTLYLSIPNVRNLHVLANLAAGEWPHEGAGIQDVTHLRFFTRSTLLQMLQETGWVANEIRVNPDPRLLPMFQGRDLAAINTIDAGSLTLRNLQEEDVLELLALQFFVSARPAV